VYTTKNFFGGRMKVTLDGGWRSDEDSTGEFRAEFTAMPNNILWFWEDVYPVENGTQVANVPMTAKGLLDWFQSTPRLSISNVTTGAIGTLPATVVDVQAAASTPNEDPNDCPSAPCVNFLGFPQWDGPWGIAAGQLQRFYLADVTYGGRQHLFVAVIYPNTVEEMDAFEPVAATALASVDVPAKPA